MDATGIPGIQKNDRDRINSAWCLAYRKYFEKIVLHRQFQPWSRPAPGTASVLQVHVDFSSTTGHFGIQEPGPEAHEIRQRVSNG